MISHTKNRSQVRAGEPAISSTQNTTLRIGNTGPPGTRNPRCRSGCLRRSTRTPMLPPAQAQTASQCSRAPRQRSHVEQPRRNRHQEARNPGRKRRSSGTADAATTKMSGSKQSRDIANHTRALTELETRGSDEIIPMIAPSRTISRVECSSELCVWSVSRFSPLTTHRRRIPDHRPPRHNPREHQRPPPMYRTVQTISVEMIPIGTVRCASLHSSLAVETESKPM